MLTARRESCGPLRRAWIRLSMAPTLMMRTIIQIARGNIKKAFDAGVKVAFGTDAAVYPHGLNAHEFAVYVQLGMTPIQAIQTATVNAADLLGWSDRIG